MENGLVVPRETTALHMGSMDLPGVLGGRVSESAVPLDCILLPANVPELPVDTPSDLRVARQARKVQITGKSTHFVSLPKRWVDSSRIRGGDLIYLVPQADGRLVIEPLGLRPVRDQQPMRLWVADSSPDWVLRQIASAYVAGWSHIELPLGLPARLDPAQVRAAFLGLEIVQEPNHLMRLRVSVETNRIEPFAGLRRLRTIVRWRLAQALQAKLPEPEQEVAAPSPDESRRLAWYLLRQATELQHDGVQARQFGLKPGEPACVQRVVRAFLRIEEAVAKIGDHAPLVVPAEARTQVLELLETVIRGFVGKPQRPDPSPWRTVAALRRQLGTPPGISVNAFLIEAIEGCAEILAASDERYYSSAGPGS